MLVDGDDDEMMMWRSMESSMLLILESFGLAAVLNSRLLGSWVPALAVLHLF